MLSEGRAGLGVAPLAQYENTPPVRAGCPCLVCGAYTLPRHYPHSRGRIKSQPLFVKKSRYVLQCLNCLA